VRKTEDGKVELSQAALAAVVTACLAVGSGGAFYATRGTATSAGQSQAVTASNLLDVRVAILEERARLSAETLAEIKQTLRDIQSGVSAVDKKIDKHLSLSHDPGR
jgi:hypothetical protein